MASVKKGYSYLKSAEFAMNALTKNSCIPSIPVASNPRDSYFCFHDAIPFNSLK